MRRITKYNPALTVEITRKKAQILLGQIADGRDPTAEKCSAKMHQTTLPMQLITDYILKCMGIKPTAEVIDIAKLKQDYSYYVAYE